LSQFIERGLPEAGRDGRLGEGVPDEFPREAHVVLGHVVSEPLRPAIHAVSQLRGSVVALAEPAKGYASRLVHPRAPLEVLANAPPLIFAPVPIHVQRRVRPLKHLVSITLIMSRRLSDGGCGFDLTEHGTHKRLVVGSLWQFQPPVAEEACGRHEDSLLIAIVARNFPWPKRTLLALPALWTDPP
jgi:hypothetical protein